MPAVGYLVVVDGLAAFVVVGIVPLSRRFEMARNVSRSATAVEAFLAHIPLVANDSVVVAEVEDAGFGCEDVMDFPQSLAHPRYCFSPVAVVPGDFCYCDFCCWAASEFDLAPGLVCLRHPLEGSSQDLAESHLAALSEAAVFDLYLLEIRRKHEKRRCKCK